MWAFYRPDAMTVWKNKEVRSRLGWYYAVMNNEKPAKYLICRRIPVDIKLSEAGLDELWEEHRRAAEEFRKAWMEIKRREKEISNLPKPKQSFLDLKAEIIDRIIRSCELCERRCKVNRKEGQRGACRLGDEAYLSSYFLHLGEEAPLVPSATFFFCSCNFRCVFCQNYSISQEWMVNGEVVDGFSVRPETLSVLFKEMRDKGGRNINLVGGDPTPNLHTIVQALLRTNVNAPILWNSNFYMTERTTEILVDIIDIGLPDLKYFNDECALKLSSSPRYFETVSRNIKMFHDREVDSIVRHLVLPGHIECCTKPALKWLAENCPRFLVNIMDQYRPTYLVTRMPDRYPEITRRVSQREMEEVYRYADELGLIWRPVS